MAKQQLNVFHHAGIRRGEGVGTPEKIQPGRLAHGRKFRLSIQHASGAHRPRIAVSPSQFDALPGEFEVFALLPKSADPQQRFGPHGGRQGGVHREFLQADPNRLRIVDALHQVQRRGTAAAGQARFQQQPMRRFAGGLGAARAGHPLLEQAVRRLGAKQGAAQIHGGQRRFRRHPRPIGLRVEPTLAGQQGQPGDLARHIVRREQFGGALAGIRRRPIHRLGQIQNGADVALAGLRSNGRRFLRLRRGTFVGGRHGFRRNFRNGFRRSNRRSRRLGGSGIFQVLPPGPRGAERQRQSDHAQPNPPVSISARVFRLHGKEECLFRGKSQLRRAAVRTGRRKPAP